jgi:LmbE family N-acetylglucosaminyl deacetylase
VASEGDVRTPNGAGSRLLDPTGAWELSVATLVSFHAHPDDEAIACGGTMAKAAKAGHRVVLVVATRGEHGEVDAGVLAEGEALWQRREVETQRAAEILGAHRVEFLGYVDSGMMGTPENDATESFWQADVEEAARRLAAILEEEDADVLTIYDDHGGYGHPDHIQVHRVGVRAAELAGTPQVLESTMNRDAVKRSIESGRAAGEVPEDAPDIEEISEEFGSPEAIITTAVDVQDFVDVKRAAMAAHASQISETSFFLKMSPEAFREVFGWEWFIRRGVPADHRDDDVFAEPR